MKFIGVILVMGTVMTAQASNEPRLQIIGTPAAPYTVSFSDLKKSLHVVTCQVDSPVYKRMMVYRGFWLEDVLRVLHFPTGQEIGFEASDGYGTSLPSQEVGRHKWLLAFGEADGGWTPLPGHQGAQSPGPWYVVSSSPASYKEVPWPYGVTKIKAMKEF